MRTFTFKSLFLTVLFVLLGSLAIQAADDGLITESKAHEKGLIEGHAPHYTISLKVAKMTKQTGHYTKENGLAENSIQKLLLQLAHNAGSTGFKR